MNRIDLFVDLTRCPVDARTVSLPQTLADPDGLGALTASVTCWLPEGWPADSEAQRFPGWRIGSGPQVVEACNDALARAACAYLPLMVVLEAVTPGNEAVAELLEVLRRDPMFGFALPRQSSPGGEIHKISNGFGDDEIKLLPRRVLSDVPDLYIVPELLSSCFLVRREVVANLGPLDESFDTLAGAWLHYLCRARRVGFRCVVANTAVVACSDAAAAGVTVPREDYWKIQRIYPDTTLAREQLRQYSAHAHETLLARAFDARPEIRKTLLIDGRGMGPDFNGTSHMALGMLDGLAKVKSDWRITLLTHAEAASFHNVQTRYPDWDHIHDVSRRRFLVAYRLAQPWAIETLADLHRIALFNVHSILDTIAWDVIYPAIERLEEAWWFLADHADGIVYISVYTRDRFRARFPLSPGIRELPHYLSFHPCDYARVATATGPEEPYILLVGNEMDHKWIAPTLDLLAAAFPFQRFKALGSKKSTYELVTALPSGRIPEDEVERLYAGAQAIVFPSFYEGFGIPLLKGLSYGRTVVARRSDLLFELAARYRGPGRLVAYETPTELLEAIGRVRQGLSVLETPLGTLLGEGEESMDWVRIARSIIDFIEELSSQVNSRRWMARERAVRQCSLLKPKTRRN